MSEIITNIDRDLDVIFGEYRDLTAVQEFVASVRAAGFTGTLYIGYPVLTVDDDRIEFDALLVSRDRGVIVFDLYSFSGALANEAEAIPSNVKIRQEQQYAALYNKLNSFRELRQGRTLIVQLITLSVHPIADTFLEEDECMLVGSQRLGEISQVAADERLGDDSIEHLNAAIQRISNLRPRKKRDNVTNAGSKGAIIKRIEKQIANLDLWQKRGSIEYVNGPQRIRGLAGSGKTVVLALKAAYLHVKRPDWNIVITFNTRSLYQQFESLITRFVYAQINDEPDWSKISIMHAWGGSERDGVYSTAVAKLGLPHRDFTTAANKFGYDSAFSGACSEALSSGSPMDVQSYDMLLVDEAQDLPASFFQLAYRLVKPPKRIIWAYDDLQNLGDVRLPSATELFGKDGLGQPLVTLRNEHDHPQQDIVLPRCYRNPPWTLAAAHGLGFGIKRKEFAQIFPNLNIWKRLGYSSNSGPLGFDQEVSIQRDPQSYPEFFGELLDKDSSLTVTNHDSIEEQYTWVAQEIKKLIVEDELQHSDILIVLPNVRTGKAESARLLGVLKKNGIAAHIPGQTSSRDAIFREDSIAITHIHRAKGNEAPAVFVVNADFCEGIFGIKKRRNILFTAMTRSRAWTYISGVGENMEAISEEFSKIREDKFSLNFHYPTEEEAMRLAVSADTPLSDELLEDDFDDVRKALEKVSKTKFEQLPLDLQEQLKDVHGAGS